MISALPLFSVNLVLNSAKENDLPYAILHVQDSKPFACETIPQPEGREVYVCAFDRVVKTPIEAKNMPLVEIDFLEKEKSFYIRIMPKVNSKIMGVKNALYMNKEVDSSVPQNEYSHWNILLFEEPPFKRSRAQEGIDFPIHYPKQEKPFVGALDLNGAPISYVQGQDIRDYMDLKEDYAAKRYYDVVENSLEIAEKYPQSIFRSELLLYRLRALDKVLDNPQEYSLLSDEFDRNDLIDEAKEWINAFPSDENTPEVLMLIAKSYLDIGFKSDANYFLDILVSEHEDSSFTKRAILDFADSLYNSREENKAIKLYMDVLYSAKDLDVAAQAAIRLAEKAMSRGEDQEARDYLLKVLGANEKYLLEDKEEAYELAKRLALNGLHDVAAKVADVLLEDVNKSDDNREELMRDSGIWHAKAKNINRAYDKLQEYLQAYEYGQYKEEVQEALDELFFELEETNETKLANYYDTLINKYENKISDRALEEKAKLFLDKGNYEEVLNMQDPLMRINDTNASTQTQAHPLVRSAAQALAKQEIKNDNCTRAINLFKAYKLDSGAFDSQALFECMLRTSRFEKAGNIAQKELENSDLNEKLAWMERYTISLYGQKEYNKVVDVGEDMKKVASTLNKKVNHEALQKLFFAYMEEEQIDEALDTAQQIEKEWPKVLANSDVYIKIVKYALDERNDLLLAEYAKKILALQNEHSVHVQSPFVDFNYISALQRLERIEEALEINKGLLEKDISKKQRIRALYSAGELSLKLEQSADAKEYFQECTAIDEESSWKDICEQNLNLL